MGKNALVRQGWLRAVIGFVAFYPVIDRSVYLLRWIAKPLGFTPDRLAIVANTLFFAILAVFIARRFMDRKSFASLGLGIRRIGKDVLIGLVSPLVLMGAGFLILYFSGYIQVTSYNANFGSLLYWGITLLLAAALEEITFRGYMLGNMMESMNKYVAVGIVSLVFGVLHATGNNVTLVGLVSCTLMGALVGIYYVHKRNLWAPIVFHTGWNFFQGTIFGFSVSGRAFDYSLLTIQTTGNNLLTGGKNGLEGSLVLAFLTLVAILAYGMVRVKGKNVKPLQPEATFE